MGERPGHLPWASPRPPKRKSDSGCVGRRIEASSGTKRLAKPISQEAAEDLLDGGVERADRPVQLVGGDRRQRQFAAEEDRILDADREVGADEALVAAQQVLVQLGGVLLRRRHHVRLVAQRALAEGDPHRRDVLLLAGHPHEPPALVAIGTIDGAHGGCRTGERRQPSVDVGLQAASAAAS